MVTALVCEWHAQIAYEDETEEAHLLAAERARLEVVAPEALPPPDLDELCAAITRLARAVDEAPSERPSCNPRQVLHFLCMTATPSQTWPMSRP